MDIEESKRRLKILIQDECICSECMKNKEAYKTILQELDNKEKEISNLRWKNAMFVKSIKSHMDALQNSILKKKIEDERWRCLKEAGSYDISNATIKQHKLIGGFEILDKLLEDK